MSSETRLRSGYERVKSVCRKDWSSAEAGDAIIDLALLALRFLDSRASLVPLVSHVPGKDYVSYRFKKTVARPANKEFFVPNGKSVCAWWRSWQRGTLDADQFARMSYTVALTPCLAMELFDRQNKKGPATYFECLVGHIFAKSVGCNPAKSIFLTAHGRRIRMTMDFLFDTGPDGPNIHLPVKMSTRERVVQAWSHQRLLDAAYGSGYYKGIMVLFSETKMDSRSLQVVEICVPDQWLAYQTFLAKIDRIYYFDVPARYEALTQSFPEVIQIGHFRDFFTETESVLGR